MKRIAIPTALLALVASLMFGCVAPQSVTPDATEPPEEATAVPTETPAPTPTPLPVFNLDGTWETLSTMPNPRARMPAVLIGNLVYVPGGGESQGLKVFEAYDPVEDTWKTLDDLPVAVTDPMAAAYDGRLYLMGGHNNYVAQSGFPATWVYDPATDQWKELASMPEYRWGGDAVVLDNYIYVVGGIGPSTDVLRYEPASDMWTALAGQAVQVWGLQAVVLDGQIWAMGGSDNLRYRYLVSLPDVWVYDPAADSWAEGPPMTEPRIYHSAEVYGRQIVVTGGFGPRWEDVLKTTELYDPDLGSWVSGPELPRASWAMGSAIFGDQMYLFGGNGARHLIENVVVYSP